MTSKILVNVDRNNFYESSHRGWVAVSNNNGKLISGTHKKYPEFFLRSTIKPVQALPFLFCDALNNFGFGIKEIAVLCSSHSGEEIHIKTVKNILEKIKLKESDLKCGTHLPYSPEVANDFIIKNKKPTEVYCNCSGKHSGMLATCLINGWSINDYYDYSHPLQKEIRLHLKNLTNMDSDKFKWGIDGCGIPTYSLPLNKLAEIFAKISNPNSNLSPKYQKYFELIKKAFFEYPEIIAGTNRVDTQVMTAERGKYISKIGGEAVLGFGIPGKNIGFAIKLEDGANRAMLPTIIKSLELLGQDCSNDEIQKLKTQNIENNAKSIVGKVYPIFSF